MNRSSTILVLVLVAAAIAAYSVIKRHTDQRLRDRQGFGIVGNMTLEVPGAPRSFGGWVDGRDEKELVFAVLAHPDDLKPVAGDGETGGGTSRTRSSTSGTWSGYHERHGDHGFRSWGYRIHLRSRSLTDGIARFGDQQFELADGNVFVVHGDLRVSQARGEHFGRVPGAAELERLAAIYRKLHARSQEQPRETGVGETAGDSGSG